MNASELTLQRNHRLFNSKISLSYFYALAVLGPIVFLILPVLLGAMYSNYGYSESQLGSFATAELVGMAVASAVALFWIKRWNWRYVLLACLTIVVIGNLVTYKLIGQIDFNQLLFIRFLTGLSAGSLMAIFLGFLSEQTDTDRAAGLFIIIQVSIQSLGLYLLPSLLASTQFGGIFTGAKGVFALIAICGALLIPLFRLSPTNALAKSADRLHKDLEPENFSRLPVFLILASFIFFFITQTSIWGFLELMGSNSGMSQVDTILAISLSTLLSISGPAFAAYNGDRFGRFKPLLVAALMQVIALILLGSLGLNFSLYLILLTLFQAGWNMALAYHFSTLIDADLSHRYIVLLPTAQALGIAIGPLAGGMAIESYGYSALLITAGVSFAIYCALILPAARQQDA